MLPEKVRNLFSRKPSQEHKSTIRSKKQDSKKFVRSLITQELVRKLCEIPTGEIITYNTLSGIAGENSQLKARGTIESARKILHRDYNIDFITLTNIGLKRAENSEIVTHSKKYISRSRNSIKKGCSIYQCLNYDGLNNEEKVHANTTSSMLGVLELITRPKIIKRIEQEVRKHNEPLQLETTLQETLKLFEKKGGTYAVT
jgi:hypothetical protein